MRPSLAAQASLDLERDRAQRERVGLARTTISTGRGPLALDLLDHEPGPVLERDQPEPSRSKIGLSDVGHHAAVPRAPVERHDPAARKPPSLSLGPLVQELVGRRVGHLAHPPEPGRGRGEEDQEPKRARIDRLDERRKPLDLGVEDLGELGVGLVLDPAVGQDAGAVDQPRIGPDRMQTSRQQVLHGGAVPDVDGVIGDRRAGRLDPLEVAADLPLRLDQPEPVR